MRLNHDCIRDILIYVESNTDDNKICVSSDELLNALPKYDKNTLFYHIRRIDSAGLFDKICYADNEPKLISNLSWNGHDYIDNIRDDKVWAKTKAAANKITSVSLSVLIKKAADIAFSFI